MKNINIGYRLGGAIAIVVLILLSVIGVGSWNLTRYTEANALDNHTQQVLRHMNVAMAAMIDIETGQRGFLVAATNEYLGTITSGKKQFEKSFNDVKNLTTDNVLLQDQLLQLKSHYDKWSKEAVDPSITTRRTIGDDLTRYAEVVAIVSHGKTEMDIMRKLVDDIRTVQQTLLEATPHRDARTECIDPAHIADRWLGRLDTGQSFRRLACSQHYRPCPQSGRCSR
ncbi:MAG: methyl-accepting chemotaxis protein [Burkholderiaceae bacterium]|jgi:methyl-accepting chemotaxis protein